MNKLFVGFNREISLKGRRRFLFIDDELPDFKGAKVFDLSKHSLNPLKGIDHVKARQLASVLYTLYPQGENTLTVRKGRIELKEALTTTRRLDLIDDSEEVNLLIKDILSSPLLQRVLCNRTNFSFNANSTILIRLNRAEIGDFDALVLGLIFINHFKGQLIIPDFGFYGREAHISLIRENRLIAGINTLAELPLRLRQAVLSIPDKQGHGALYDDAQTLAKYEGLTPQTNGFNAFVDEAMA